MLDVKEYKRFLKIEKRLDKLESVLSGAERSGVLQGCLPSATGSASDAASVQKSQCGMDGSEVSKPSDTRKEDGHGADSSVVQLPVSELSVVENQLSEHWRELQGLAEPTMNVWLTRKENEDHLIDLIIFLNRFLRAKEKTESAPSAARASGGS